MHENVKLYRFFDEDTTMELENNDNTSASITLYHKGQYIIINLEEYVLNKVREALSDIAVEIRINKSGREE